MSEVEVKSRVIKAGNRNIHVSESGKGYPVVMLHGGGPGASGLSNYSRNIAALSESFRVIVPDMPGYGGSTKGLDQKNLAHDLASGIFAMMDALGIAKAHVIGNSLGGVCALRMALDNPKRVSANVLMGPGAVGITRGFPPKGITKGLQHLFDYYKGFGPSKEKLSHFIKDYLVYDSSQITDALIESRYQASLDPEVIANPPLQGVKSLSLAIKSDLTRDKRLKQCQVPTLVIWGIEDKVNPAWGGQMLVERMPNCELYLMSKTGHWAQWERATEFNALVKSYLTPRTPNDV